MKPPAVRQFISNTGIRIYRIKCRVLPHLPGRVYLVIGEDGPTLVDAGSGEGESTSQILSGMEVVHNEFGEDSVAGGVRRIVLTHGHIDHVGGCAELADRFGAEVWVHPFDASAVQRFEERAVIVNYVFRRYLAAAGIDAERIEAMLGDFGYRRGRIQSLARVRFLEDGQNIAEMEVFHTPGHSPGHVCLRIGDHMLTGDHVLSRTISQQWPETVSPHTGLAHYFASLDRIAALDGVRVMLPAHEAVIDDPAGRIQSIRRGQTRRLERMRSILSESPEGLTMAEIVRRMYAAPAGSQAVLALTDIGARIEFLQQRGEIAIANVDEIDGNPSPVFKYRLTAS